MKQHMKSQAKAYKMCIMKDAVKYNKIDSSEDVKYRLGRLMNEYNDSLLPEDIEEESGFKFIIDRLMNKPTVNPPTEQPEFFSDIYSFGMAAKHGELDSTEAFTGEVVYQFHLLRDIENVEEAVELFTHGEPPMMNRYQHRSIAKVAKIYDISLESKPRSEYTNHNNKQETQQQ